LILFLMQYGGSIVAQILLWLGLRWLTHKVADNFMHATFASLFGSLSPVLAHTMALMKADVAVSIVLSAVVFKMGKEALTHLAPKAST
jgi:Protein of unknown function (DUF2523)